MESQYVRNKFYVVKTEHGGDCKLRCVYCESDIEDFVVASKKNKWYAADPAALLRTDDHHLKEHRRLRQAKPTRAKLGFIRRRAAAEPRPDTGPRPAFQER